ncbi:MAG: discoidin domain-containing protein [Myxococcota bacterium]|nr:discoidin domain-containing protein [Myxococcota bacterium]
MANNFDATQFANDLAAMQVEFVIFTAWHKNMVCLWPSTAMARWLPTGHTTTRDVLADMIAAVKAKGIRVLFYTHPRDGHDFNAADQAAAGWSPFNYPTWNNFINDVYAELITRYGSQIDGIYLDEGGQNDTYVDYVRLRATVKGINPNLLMIQNYYGNIYTADEGDQEFDYWGQFTKNSDGTRWQSYSRGVGPVFASNWWASVAKGTNTVTWTPASMFTYVVLQAGTNTDGLGVQWAAGPYPGNGGGFETGVVSALTSVGRLIAPIASSIKNSLPSTSYVTKPLSSLSTLTWGVATRTPDDATEFIHVLKAPGTKTLTLPVPADGKLFGTASLVSNGHVVTLSQTATAVTLTLDAADSWDPYDTAIKLTVTSKNSNLAFGKLVLTTSSVDVDNSWGAQKVTDGVTTSVPGTSMGYSSNTPTTMNHKEDLTVDLGANDTVSRVVLWPRSDAPNAGYGFPVAFTIGLSTNNVDWATVVTKTGYQNPGAAPQTFNVPATTARYVRVEGTNLRQNPNDTNTYKMQFAEMAVY